MFSVFWIPRKDSPQCFLYNIYIYMVPPYRPTFLDRICRFFDTFWKFGLDTQFWTCFKQTFLVLGVVFMVSLLMKKNSKKLHVFCQNCTQYRNSRFKIQIEVLESWILNPGLGIQELLFESWILNPGLGIQELLFESSMLILIPVLSANLANMQLLAISKLWIMSCP